MSQASYPRVSAFSVVILFMLSTIECISQLDSTEFSTDECYILHMFGGPTENIKLKNSKLTYIRLFIPKYLEVFIMLELSYFCVYILSDIFRFNLYAFLKCDFQRYVQTKVHPYVVTKSFYRAL